MFTASDLCQHGRYTDSRLPIQDSVGKYLAPLPDYSLDYDVVMMKTLPTYSEKAASSMVSEFFVDPVTHEMRKINECSFTRD